MKSSAACSSSGSPRPPTSSDLPAPSRLIVVSRKAKLGLRLPLLLSGNWTELEGRRHVESVLDRHGNCRAAVHGTAVGRLSEHVLAPASLRTQRPRRDRP